MDVLLFLLVTSVAFIISVTVNLVGAIREGKFERRVDKDGEADVLNRFLAAQTKQKRYETVEIGHGEYMLIDNDERKTNPRKPLEPTDTESPPSVEMWAADHDAPAMGSIDADGEIVER